MNIIHISAECYPIAKVGGLADVVGALPKYQKELGVESSVIMPFYNTAFTQKNTFETIYHSNITLSEDLIDYKVLQIKDSTLGFDIYFIDIDMLHTDYVYSADDTERFIAFQIATLNWILTLKNTPDVLHVHDHHTGLIPFMMSYCYAYNALKDIPTVLTIHNAQYQGWFPHDKVYLLPAFDYKNVGQLDWYGNINPLASAIKCAWKVTTVSPSYMEELKQEANHLEGLLSHESDKCVGILNGIDWDTWNTETDSFLIKNYTKTNIIGGKKVNKEWLCKEFNLDETKPLFAFIGRLVYEKGTDLFPAIFSEALDKNDISILLLGSGDKETEQQLEQLQEKENFNAYIGYNEKLSHIIYAGADFLLMPSRVEPCGLNQLYALRYGTMPIVNEIGGLKDTVTDIKDNGIGITFNGVTVENATDAISRASQFYTDKKAFQKNSKKMMSIDYSWNTSAQEYLNLYKTL